MNSALRLVSMTENPVSSSPEIMVVPTSSAHIRELAMTIRESDKREIESYGFTCTKGLWRSFKFGVMNRTALIDGKVAACWGCQGSLLGAVGVPWLLTSNEVRKISPLRFARIYQKEVYKMLKLFPYLVNHVDMNYHEAVRLLQIIGFEVGEPEKYGMGMFRKFEMVRG